MAWECNRFSFGDIERGPVRFLAEYHNHLSVPAGCQAEQGPIYYWILASIWVNDPEIAGLLRAEGMNALAATIEASDSSATGVPTRTWTWSAGDYQPSSMAITQELSSMTSFPKLPSRWYWQNDRAGISFMDVSYHALGALGPPNVDAPAASQRPMTGTMNQPMLTAAMGGNYAGFGTMLEQGEFDADISRFGDMTCEASY